MAVEGRKLEQRGIDPEPNFIYLKPLVGAAELGSIQLPSASRKGAHVNILQSRRPPHQGHVGKALTGCQEVSEGLGGLFNCMLVAEGRKCLAKAPITADFVA